MLIDILQRYKIVLYIVLYMLHKIIVYKHYDKNNSEQSSM